MANFRQQNDNDQSSIQENDDDQNSKQENEDDHDSEQKQKDDAQVDHHSNPALKGDDDPNRILPKMPAPPRAPTPRRGERKKRPPNRFEGFIPY